MYQVWDIIHDVAIGSCLKKSMCHVALTYEVEDILLSIAGGKSDGTAVPCVRDEDDWLTEMFNITVLLYRKEIFYIGFNIFSRIVIYIVGKYGSFSKCYPFIHIYI